jgi:hypothetical protein
MTDTSPSPEQLEALASQTDGAAFFGADEPDEPASPPEVDNSQVAELKGQLSMLTKQIEQMQQANMTLMMRPEQPQLPANLPQLAPKPDPLPDPLDDAEGYANALADRIAKQIEAKQTASQTQQQMQQSSQAKYNELWENFQITHKDYAKDFRKVKYAANIAAENIAKRGIDVEKYMFTYRDQFMKDVTGIMDEVFGQASGGTGNAGTPAPDPVRTGGMFGGMDSGGRPAQSAPAMQEDNAFADIREWQIKSGFHR